jgi:exopolysaccharide production protein ExoQ
MLSNSFQRTLDLLLVFSLFFLSNILAFAYAFWLVPALLLLASIFWLILTAFSLWNVYKNNLLHDFLDNFRRTWTFLPFLIFSALSILWSVNREISAYRWLVLLCTLITGAYIGLRYSMKEIIKQLSVFGIYILFVGSIFVFLIPDIGIMNYYIIQGAWKGVYWHKNHMGLLATFINILFLINIIDAFSSRQKSILLWGVLYIYSLVFIYQTDSVASYLTTIFLHGLIIIAFFLLNFRQSFRRVHYVLFGVLVVVASVFFYINLDRFLGVFNRNTSLTGRIPMWSYLFDAYINQKPLLGYGFNAFWYIKTHQVALQQAAGYPDTIIIADNGFLDILVNTGYIGLGLFLIFYSDVWWQSLRYAGKAKEITGLFPMILMSFTLIANISWSLIFENESFFMLLMVSVLFCISSGTTLIRQRGITV